MNNEERILAMLEKLNGTVEEHGAMLTQMQDEQKQIRGEMSQMRGELGQMKTEMGQMQTTLTRVALTQENIVLKSLDALAEGQDLTHQRLKDLAGKDELAELREEVRLLRTVVAQHTRDIEALKAAQ